jgi:hypothetical protein
MKGLLKKPATDEKRDTLSEKLLLDILLPFTITVFKILDYTLSVKIAAAIGYIPQLSVVLALPDDASVPLAAPFFFTPLSHSGFDFPIDFQVFYRPLLPVIDILVARARVITDALVGAIHETIPRLRVAIEGSDILGLLGECCGPPFLRVIKLQAS